MKKYILLTIAGLSLTFLSGCDSITRAIRGDAYVDAQQSSSLLASQSQEDNEALQAALKADQSAFPQLSDTVAEDEAEVILHTSMGDMTIKLFPSYAPLAVENFLTHAKEGYYNGLTFHRVIDNFMIQSGDPNGDGTGGESIWSGKDASIDDGSGFANEISPYLYNLRGALAMANAGEDTNGSQFFINQNPKNQAGNLSSSTYPEPIIQAYKDGGNPSLDGDYTVFGQVIDGLAIVDEIASVETDSQDKPTTAVTITSITIVKE